MSNTMMQKHLKFINYDDQLYKHLKFYYKNYELSYINLELIRNINYIINIMNIGFHRAIRKLFLHIISSIPYISSRCRLIFIEKLKNSYIIEDIPKYYRHIILDLFELCFDLHEESTNFNNINLYIDKLKIIIPMIDLEYKKIMLSRSLNNYKKYNSPIIDKPNLLPITL
jgi:hypothetical protein